MMRFAKSGYTPQRTQRTQRTQSFLADFMFFVGFVGFVMVCKDTGFIGKIGQNDW